MPTAFDPWDNADREICGTLTAKPFDYTKKGQIVIFEYEERDERKTNPPRILAGQAMEAGKGHL